MKRERIETKFDNLYEEAEFDKIYKAAERQTHREARRCLLSRFRWFWRLRYGVRPWKGKV